MIPAYRNTWQERLQELTEDLIAAERDDPSDHEDYQGIRLIDSYFSFPRGTLIDYLHSKKHSTKILILDPHSEVARARYRMLRIAEPKVWKGGPFYEAALTFYRLGDELAEYAGDTNPISEPSLEEPWKWDFAGELRKFEDLVSSLDYRLEVRFYSVATDAPVYLLGHFAVKGLMMNRAGARRNPWLVFVDDPNEDDDVYSRLSRNFDDIWKIASRLPSHVQSTPNPDSGDPTAFIIMGMGDDKDGSRYSSTDIHRTLRDVCSNLRIVANRVNEGGSLEPITDQIVRSIDSHDIILCDLSGSRPNVYYEAGFAHGLKKEIIFTAFEETEVHFDLKHYPIIYYKNLTDLKEHVHEKLDKWIEETELKMYKIESE